MAPQPDPLRGLPTSWRRYHRCPWPTLLPRRRHRRLPRLRNLDPLHLPRRSLPCRSRPSRPA